MVGCKAPAVVLQIRRNCGQHHWCFPRRAPNYSPGKRV